MVRMPQDFCMDDQDSGLMIHLDRSFLASQNQPSPPNGRDCHVHRESSERGSTITRWTMQGKAYVALRWSIWCWDTDDLDAVRIYLQIVSTDTDAESRYLNAFPSSIMLVTTDIWPHYEIVVGFAGESSPPQIQFPQCSYCWCNSYCAAESCITETPSPDGGVDTYMAQPGERFSVEDEFEMRHGHALMVQQAKQLTDALRSGTVESSAPDRVDAMPHSLREQGLIEMAELARQVGNGLSELTLRILLKVPKPWYLRVFSLMHGGNSPSQRAVAEKMNISVGSVNKAVMWIREEGFTMPGQRGQTDGHLLGGQSKNGRSASLPFTDGSNLDNIPGPEGPPDIDLDSWPGEEGNGQ